MFVFKHITIRSFFSIVFLICYGLLQAQLSRTHYIPPITAASDNNAIPQNQYLHISTPNENPVNVAVNQVGSGVINYTVSNTSPLEIYIGIGDNTPFILPVSNTASSVSNKGLSLIHI